MIRLSALLALLFVFQVNLAHAVDFPGSSGQGQEPGQGPGNGQGPGQDPGQTLPPPAPIPGQPGQGPGNGQGPGQEPGPGPQIGICSGLFEGYYLDDPAPVTFQLDQAGQWGDLHVTAWWRGGMWNGQGICREISPCQASVEIYFPGAPVHRAVINSNGQYAVMEGQIDYGRAFHLTRTH